MFENQKNNNQALLKVKTVYFISGLGADERVFAKLQLQRVKQVFIKWIPPNEKEPLKAYCNRLLQQIDQSKPVYLIGVSFGGIVAQEISKLIKVQKVIIISSVKSPSEYSWSIKLARRLKLNRIVPSKILKHLNHLSSDYYFSIKTKSESDLLRKIIEDTDTLFMVWAIEQILTWENESQHSSLLHLHGDNDRIFPLKYIKDATLIKGGGHFMIYNRASEITALINLAIGY